MKMLVRCNKCNSTAVEHSEYSPTSQNHETNFVCSNCGHEWLEIDVVQCDVCLDWIHDTSLKTCGDKVMCPDCFHGYMCSVTDTAISNYLRHIGRP